MKINTFFAQQYRSIVTELTIGLWRNIKINNKFIVGMHYILYKIYFQSCLGKYNFMYTEPFHTLLLFTILIQFFLFLVYAFKLNLFY